MKNITPKTEVTEEIMRRAKKRHRRNTWLGLLLSVAVAFVFAGLFVGAVNEYYDGVNAYATTTSAHMGHGSAKYHDPVRIRKGVIVQTMKVKGRDTDCINAQNCKYVQLNTVVTKDGNMWRFYSTWSKNPKYRIHRKEIVRLWIFNNHTKDKTDDEIIGVSSHCMVR